MSGYLPVCSGLAAGPGQLRWHQSDLPGMVEEALSSALVVLVAALAALVVDARGDCHHRGGG